MQAKPVVGTHVYRRRARGAIGPIDGQGIVGLNERRADLVAAIGGLVLVRIDQGSRAGRQGYSPAGHKSRKRTMPREAALAVHEGQ
jgi:hypothetical protein